MNTFYNKPYIFLKDQLKITLFYETLCPDCQYFVTQQLYPAYKKIGDSLKIDLVPYGFASVIYQFQFRIVFKI